MSEGLKVIALGIGYLVIFGAVGSGPAFVLARSAESRLLLAPALGLSIAASVLTTVSLVMPMHTAAWAVLVPVAVVSLIVAVWQLRRDRVIAARGTAIAAAFVAAGLLLAAAPALDRGTVGPFGLGVYDAWGYVQADLWLQGHTLLDDPPADAGRWDLSLAYGHALTEDNTRIGVSVVNAAGASLFGQRPDETLFAFLAMLFALVPATVWIVARRLGAGPVGAALGACFGLSPALFTLVGDSALANLIAVVLAPLALLFAVLGLERRNVRELVLAAILIAGLASVYPEFIPPLALSGALAVTVLTVPLLRRTGPREGLRGLLIGIAVLAGVVVILAPLGAFRAYSYLSRIGGDSPLFAGLPPRFMTFENSGAWAFGVLHIYQLQRFDLLSQSKMVLAVVLPLALAVLVAIGALRSMRDGLARPRPDRRADRARPARVRPIPERPLRILPLEVPDVHAALSRCRPRARARCDLGIQVVANGAPDRGGRACVRGYRAARADGREARARAGPITGRGCDGAPEARRCARRASPPGRDPRRRSRGDVRAQVDRP